MRLEEVLPELMGSLTLSELFFRGEGPPRAWNRMDQYHRKMRKPVGSEAHASLGSETHVWPLVPSQSPSVQGSSHILRALESLVMIRYPVACQWLRAGLT